MHETRGGAHFPQLEGLRVHPSNQNAGTRNRLHAGLGAEGIERLEAALSGQAFAPHRHDTYAIGLTLRGVQTFRYRGERRQCLPGEGHILHPDEVHDGAAGTEEGFAYRIVYVDPALVQQALGGRTLPFVADPVVPRSHLPPALITCLHDLDEPLGDLERLEFALVIADMLARLSAAPRRQSGPLPLVALSRVRDLIAADPAVRHPVRVFEDLSGLDRWTVARGFRAAFGTSPSRFRTLRQLDQVRALLRGGVSPAGAALTAGFADQSHMSRLFKRAYGLTPGQWAAALR